MDNGLRSAEQRVERLHYKLNLHSPAHKLANQHASMIRLEQQLIDAMNKRLTYQRHQLALAAETLDAVSPLATLKRGYSISQNAQGDVVTSTKQMKSGDTLVTRLADGTLFSTIS